MPPSDFRRRRRRRLSRAGATALVVALVAVLGVVVLVGSITSVGKESGPYWRDVDQSYAAEMRGLVRQSNATDAELRSVVARISGDTRIRLEASLDTLVTTSQSLAREAATVATPAPAAGAGVDITRAMVDRATAIADLRRTVNGLLGMAPLTGPAAGGITTAASARHTLSASAAADRLGEVSTLLAAADRLYGAGRAALVRAPGHARLPASAWMGHTVALRSGGAQSIVREVTSSRSLAAVADVVLVPHALVLTPAPVPPAQGSSTPGTLRLPPTSRLALTAVVADKGNVPEPDVVVEAALQPAHGRPVVERSHRLALTPHADASVALPTFKVLPAARYTLTLRVVSPRTAAAANRAETLSISIAPPAPATVLQVTPPYGTPSGGTAVKILGASFTSVRAVYFGKARARFTVVANSQITAIAPPGTGTVTVTVVNRGGRSIGSSLSHFTYKIPKKKHVP